MGYLAVASPRQSGGAKVAALRTNIKRRRALAAYAILDTDPEPAFSAIAALAREIFGAPSAAISFLDEERQWFKAGCGLGIRETPIEQSFCKFASDRDEVFIVTDARLDARFASNPLVLLDPKIRFYAGMRVTAADGTPIGALCVLDNQPRPQGLSPTETLALKVLAAQVEALLELRRAVLDQRNELATKEQLAHQLSYVAEHDGLTGLSCREPFQARLIEAVQRAGKDGTRVAMMFIDVDHFKQVNDTLGHDVGDEILRSFAVRLKSTLRKGDTVARLGGDEFGAVLCDISKESTLQRLVHSMTERLNQPIQHKGRTIECRASIGVAVYPDHAANADRLMKCSDLALARAKEVRGCAVTFDERLSDQFERETRMLEIARKGLQSGNILPYYQVKVDLKGERLIGFEALVRCTQASGALLLPEAFAHALEDRKVARLIGETMLEQVLDDAKSWADRGLEFGHVAINTSAADFQGDSFGERLLDGLARRGLSSSQIEVEVTENVFLGRGADYVARALELLSSRGIRISLDDFGTGYGSLTHLKQFPVDAIKIDRSFVDGIGRRADDTTIVKTLIGLGRSLGIETIAEGLETEQQVAFVRSHGCAVGQGFIFGRALPAAQIGSTILGWTRRAAA